MPAMTMAMACVKSMCIPWKGSCDPLVAREL
jgi:hypothetical protein